MSAVFAPASSNTAFILNPSSSFAESTELRIRQAAEIVFFLASDFTMARLVDVSTSPAMLSLMRITPLGQATIAAVILSWSFFEITFLGLFTSSSVTASVGSVTESSALITSVKSSISLTKLFVLEFLTASTPKASRGMALRKLQPSNSASFTPSFSCAAFNKRKNTLIALPLPSGMSIPE